MKFEITQVRIKSAELHRAQVRDRRTFESDKDNVK